MIFEFVEADCEKSTLTSTLDNICNWGIWDVTQVKKPCVSIIKGKMVKYEQFGKSSIEEDFVNIDGDIIVANCPAKEDRGYKIYVLSEDNGFKTVFETDEGKIEYMKEFETDISNEYAHNSNIEVYSDFNKNYAELEAHSPLLTFAKKGESNYFTVNWSFKVV